MKGENDMKKNEENIFLEDIEMPRIVEEKISDTLLKIKMEEINVMREKESTDTKRKNKLKNPLKPLIAVAACAILVVTFLTNGNVGSKTPNVSMTTDTDKSDLQWEDKSKISFPDFSITAYAKELDIVEPSEGNVIFVDAGIGENGYTGIMFSIKGNEISNVDISIDKGELYSAIIDDTTEETLHDWMAQGMPDMDGDPNTYTIVETDGLEQREEEQDIQNIRIYHCTKRGTNFMEQYDSETYYGFYIPDHIISTMDDETDLAVASHNMLNIFDGAVLTVTVTYSDGSSFRKEYELSTAKLAQDENGTITQEEWTGGDEGAFVYGIVAREKK